ncbi:MAG: hypothetical protein K2O56_05885, partial [Muribaculaceae bacterium]|nr:hypothetical protein [Muribaculaceae bacterium]
MKQITKNKAPWLTGLMAGAVLCSCSNEAPFMPEPVTGVEGDYPVILNLNGLTAATRAYSEDGERYAALDRERTINSLYAVAFYDGDVADNDVIYSSGTLYKVFKVTLPGDGNYVPKDADTERPYFDMTSGGKFKLWFVANPGDELLAK